MKSGNLNYLEPSGTLQACNGIALRFIIIIIIIIISVYCIYISYLLQLFHCSNIR